MDDRSVGGGGGSVGGGGGGGSVVVVEVVVEVVVVVVLVVEVEVVVVVVVLVVVGGSVVVVEVLVVELVVGTEVDVSTGVVDVASSEPEHPTTSASTTRTADETRAAERRQLARCTVAVSHRNLAIQQRGEPLSSGSAERTTLPGATMAAVSPISGHQPERSDSPAARRPSEAS